MIESGLPPWLYHAHHRRYRADLDFWLGLARQQGDPVLELGCGTGRVTLPLARAGFHIVGLDRDASRLAFLRSRLPPDPDLRLHLLQADMTRFRLASRFALVIMPCNTVSTLTAGERRALFRRVRAHLLPSGRFVASAPNPSLLAELPPSGEPEVEETFVHPGSGHPVQVSSAWRRTPEGITIEWIYDHLLPDGGVERWTAVVAHSLIGPAAYQRAFEEAGLQLITTYGDFDGAPYTLDAPYLILLAGPISGAHL